MTILLKRQENTILIYLLKQRSISDNFLVCACVEYTEDQLECKYTVYS